MKTWMKILIVLAILGGIGAWAGYTFIYNKPHTDYEKAMPAYKIPAKDLFNEFRANPKVAGDKYTGQVIQVSGRISDIEEADTLIIAVFAFEDGMFGAEGVRVSMLPEHGKNLKKESLTEVINLKGFCPGYNGSDVIIESGSIVK